MDKLSLLTETLRRFKALPGAIQPVAAPAAQPDSAEIVECVKSVNETMVPLLVAAREAAVGEGAHFSSSRPALALGAPSSP